MVKNKNTNRSPKPVLEDFSAGAANEAVMSAVEAAWVTSARAAGVNLSGYSASAPLEHRIDWANSVGLSVGCILSRFSTKLQQSTTEQATENASWAGAHKIYVPPEYVCVDEGVTGKKQRRVGLDRVRALLEYPFVSVLLVYKVSRIFRKAYYGLKFFTEDIVEADKRAISTSQGIDTADDKRWKCLAYMHGMSDELLLDAIADHVRIGLRSLHRQKMVTGALTVGYDAVPIEGAPLTKNGKPRTMPRPNQHAAQMILQHYRWIAEGMSIREGLKRWNRDGGPFDPRSTRKRMTYSAYRRMLSNPRFRGIWAFGRKKNCWNNKKDYNRQTLQPESQVEIYQCEELRIVPDEVYNRVQAVLAAKKGRPSGPHKSRAHQLWDLVTHCFLCEACSRREGKPIRMYQCGAFGHAMRCKNGVECSAICMVNRRDAVQSICAELARLLARDEGLIAQTCALANTQSESGDADNLAEIGRLKRRIQGLDNKVKRLHAIMGADDENSDETDAEIVATNRQRTYLRVEVDQREKLQRDGSFTITPQQVQAAVSDLCRHLTEGAAGSLGENAIFKAVTVFEMLVGEQIWVSCEARPGRKRTTVQGVFRPLLTSTIRQQLEDPRGRPDAEAETVRVWLRSPPKCDVFAKLVHQLVDVDGLSLAEADRALRQDGHKLHKNSTFAAYRRYYQMIGQQPPPRPYNNGKPRKKRAASN